jgi:hypothetical protein
MKNKYLKENFEPIIMNSKNLTEVLIKFNLGIKGNNRKTLQKYIKLYNINISHFETSNDRYERTIKYYLQNKHKISLDKILVVNSTYSSTNDLKNRLYKERLKERKCEKCEQDENWNGEHISLILDHINGINNDNRFENLRIVCPNCNATLLTHCRGKMGLIKKIKSEKYKITLNRRKVERPLYKQLLNEIKNLGYCKTGRKYGVSDNAIRKWIKSYEKYNN